MPTLLPVDDKPENIIVLEAVLSSDYVLHTANSGPEALEILEKMAVDVILLDIQMPEAVGGIVPVPGLRLSGPIYPECNLHASRRCAE